MYETSSEADGQPHKGATNRALSVIDRLREAIQSGAFNGGERINEVRLSEQLKVSRTPTRAALQLLAGEGLLNYAPNRGYTVRDYSLSEVVEAYDARALLEGLAARLAAQRGLSGSERAAIEGSLAEGDELFKHTTFGRRDRSKYRHVNAIFHDTVLAAARNRMLKEMIRICQYIPAASNRNIIAFEFNDVRRRHDDHHRIYEAICARDSELAASLMHNHVQSIKVSLARLLDRTPSPEISRREGA
jgi:GntR family transcriptional regulator of vanillate catabolism